MIKSKFGQQLHIHTHKLRGGKELVAEGGGVENLVTDKREHKKAHVAFRTKAARDSFVALVRDLKLKGVDALLATVQMPAGVPVGTLAIGGSGAENAAILAAQILALADKKIATRLDRMKKAMAAKVPGLVEQVAAD